MEKTKMTVNGVSTTTELGTEQFEYYTSKMGFKKRRLCQYDYRHTNGKLFSCVKSTLEACRNARNEWLKEA